MGGEVSSIEQGLVITKRNNQHRSARRHPLCHRGVVPIGAPWRWSRHAKCANDGCVVRCARCYSSVMLGLWLHLRRHLYGQRQWCFSSARRRRLSRYTHPSPSTMRLKHVLNNLIKFTDVTSAYQTRSNIYCVGEMTQRKCGFSRARRSPKSMWQRLCEWKTKLWIRKSIGARRNLFNFCLMGATTGASWNICYIFDAAKKNKTCVIETFIFRTLPSYCWGAGCNCCSFGIVFPNLAVWEEFIVKVLFTMDRRE